MGILEQLFNFNPEIDGSQDVSMSPEDVILISIAQNAHQAMNDGMRATNVANSIIQGIDLNISGTVNVEKSLQLSSRYRENLVNDQLAEPGDRPTADDVVDGGIKRGQKVVFEVIGNRYLDSGSWDEVVKKRMTANTDQPIGVFFDKFSVMNFSEPEAERHQIHETFGAEIIQSFGRRPRLITMSGQIMNGRVDVLRAGAIRSMDWKNALQRFYEEHFSLKACLSKKHKVRITAQDTIWHGYLLNLVTVTDAENQGVSQATITFIVSKKVFRKQNDLAIPGFFNENGFRITGATIPDEYFPQERLEFYFNEDLSEVVSTKITSLKRDIELTKAGIEFIAGQTRENLDRWIDSTESLFILNLSIDAALRGSEIERTGSDIDNETIKLDSDVRKYVEDIGSTYIFGDEIPFSDDPRYEKLKEQEASLRIRQKDLREVLTNLNIECQKLRSKIAELDSYTQLQEM